MAEDIKNKEILTYKDRPLRRCGNEIYYGNMQDKYIVAMQILGTQKVGDLDVSSKVIVSLMLTDSEIKLKDRIVKSSEKDGLYNALDIAHIWLERALTTKE